MKEIEKIQTMLNQIDEDPEVNISKINDYTFDITITGKLIDSFEKLGNIQKNIEEICPDGYTLKTIYGEGQDAKLIIEKN